MNGKQAMRLLAAAFLAAGCLTALGAEEGEQAPEFSLPRLASPERLSLADFRGKVLYLDFWASWCPPCLVSLPLVDELRNRLVAAGEDFEVIAINVDMDPADALDFLEYDLEDPLDYVLLADPEGTVPARYQIRAMPSSFVIDREGRVRLAHEGFRRADMALIESAIEAALEEGR